MEEDKENVLKLKDKTQIPLPLHPLPQLPKHLLEKRNNDGKNERRPLTTLRRHTHNSEAGPSKEKELKIDTRYVTIRKKRDLDWNYSVFKDDIPKKTPVKGSLEPSRVRNIKKSLKRPHSRELQGLSPAGKQERGEEKFRRRLNFNESIEERLQPPDYWKTVYTERLGNDYGPDILSHMLLIEAPAGIPKVSTTARACLLNWLMKVNGSNGNPATVQTAAWYLDSILVREHISMDRLQLATAACYWIAQKWHGPVSTSSKLVKCSNNAFSSTSMLAAEKHILRCLKYPRSPVVPQEYISYLSWWCDNDRPGEIEVAATFLIMCAIMADRSLCIEYPSVLGTAAVLNALVLLKKRNLVIRLQNSSFYKKAESKTSNLLFLCSLIRRAVRTVSSPSYEYQAPLHQYDVPPYNIASKIVRENNIMGDYDAW